MPDAPNWQLFLWPMILWANPEVIAVNKIIPRRLVGPYSFSHEGPTNRICTKLPYRWSHELCPMIWLNCLNNVNNETKNNITVNIMGDSSVNLFMILMLILFLISLLI